MGIEPWPGLPRPAFIVSQPLPTIIYCILVAVISFFCTMYLK